MPAATSETNPYRTQCLEPEPLSRYHPVINWNTATLWHYDVSNMSFSPLATDRPIFEPIAAYIFSSLNIHASTGAWTSQHPVDWSGRFKYFLFDAS